MTTESTRPTTGMVLHQVLAHSALNFLLNDEGTIEADNPARIEVATVVPGAARPRRSGYTRAGWHSVGSAPTCVPSAWWSTRLGAHLCGPSWPGIASASEN